jgi:hypothetical protein
MAQSPSRPNLDALLLLLACLLILFAVVVTFR